MSVPQFELSNIGDIHTIDLNFLEQVASVSSYADSADGETATRTLTREFATSTDGVTFSAFQTLNNANLQALVLDADNRLYFRLRFTRGGSDATGIIQYFRGVFTYTIDPTATKNHGCISEDTIEQDLPDLLKVMIEEYVYQHSGANHFDVIVGNPNEQVVRQKPVIYIYNLDASETSSFNRCNYTNRVTFNLNVTRVRDKTVGWNEMISALRTMFQPYTFIRYPFSITFKTVVFNGVFCTELGLKNPVIQAMPEIWDDVAKQEFREFLISIDLKFSKSSENIVSL